MSTERPTTGPKCACARCNSGPPHAPTLEEFQTLQAANWALEAAIAEHDAARANLFHQQETLHSAEWQRATEQINSLQAELRRVTQLGAQWAQEREDAREQLGREMATVDDMVKDVAALQGVIGRVTNVAAEIHGHGADTLEGEILRLRDILNRIDAAVGAVTEPTPPTTGVHSPEIAEKGDGTFGVFCSQCSREAGDYIYPCKLGRWQAPPIVAAVPTSEPTPACDLHGPMTRDGSLEWWICELCGRSLTDKDVARLGGDPSKIVVT